MNYFFSALFCISFFFTFSQNLQLHYDLRHTVDANRNKKNFPSLYFEYFKSLDTGKSVIKPGSFLLKTQADFNGENRNINQFYMQVSQSLRLWKPKVFLQLQYSGGLGITEPKEYSFYITNAISLGAAYPFQWKGRAFFNVYSSYKYTAFKKPSHDIINAFFWLLFNSNYKINFAGNLVFWTENKNHGDALTENERGKKFLFFGDPQIWFSIHKGLSAGSKTNIYYHVLSYENIFLVYPTIALKYQF